MLTIREATIDDLDAVLKFIHELAIYEKMEQEIVGDKELLKKWVFDEKKAYVLIASWMNEKAGFALYFNNFSTFLTRPGIFIEDLYVKKEYRGKGIGKALITYLAEKAVSNGYGRVEWNCLNWNQPSIDFYLSLGAIQMKDWTTYRLTGNTLMQVAKKKK